MLDAFIWKRGQQKAFKVFGECDIRIRRNICSVCFWEAGDEAQPCFIQILKEEKLEQVLHYLAVLYLYNAEFGSLN